MWLVLSAPAALFLSFSFAASLVLAIYVWKGAASADRDHPIVIKQRIMSGILSTLACISLIFVVADHQFDSAGQERGDGPGLLQWVGFYPHGILMYFLLVSSFWALLLTAVLFTGPVIALILYDIPMFGRSRPFHLAAWSWLQQCVCAGFSTPADYWTSVRNLIAAPVIEETIYRGCIFTVLRAGGFSSRACLFWSPFLFGIAHLHHLISMLKTGGYSVGSATVAATAQLLITSIFGVYSGVLYIRTGNLVAPMVTHSFCNLLGPPGRYWAPKSGQRWSLSQVIIACAHVLGLVGFFVLATPLTHPDLHHASVPMDEMFRISDEMRQRALSVP